MWGIRLNNERSWYQAHREEYVRFVDAPLRELAGEIFEEMLRRYSKQSWNLHVSRIYRDARRLFGRGPYKDNLWFVVARLGEEEHTSIPCFYFGLAPECYSIGMGYFQASPLTMAKFRAKVDQDPLELGRLARRLARQDRFVLSGDFYKRPKGNWGKLLDPWYNRKSLSLDWEQNCEGVLFTPELREEILESFQFLMPYYLYLDSLRTLPDPPEASQRKGDAAL